MKKEAIVIADPADCKKKVRSKKGFTLVELVIVIAVLAIISAIAIPTVSNVISNTNTAADKTNAQAIENTIKTAQSDVEAYSTNKSTKVDSLKAASPQSLDALLKIYGVDSDVITNPKVTNDKFIFNKTSGKITASVNGSAGSDELLLTAATTYSIDGDTLTIGPKSVTS